MKSTIKNVIFSISLCLLALGSTSVNATPYFFSQDGFTGGGVISGSFDATDLNNDGQIQSFFGEVTAFSLSFSGDAFVAPFTHNLSNLFGLVYDMGSGFLGDGATGSIEGIATNISLFAPPTEVIYVTGLGPTLGLGGFVSDPNTGAFTATDHLVSVHEIPEPESFGLIALGLTVLLTKKRKRL